LEEESPDFIITVTAPPELGVFEVASDYDQSSEPAPDSEDDADDE
jgi:hypothetical protein